MTDLSRYSVPAKKVLDVLDDRGITHVTTVPDFAQLSLQMRLEQNYLPNTRVMRCCAEDQAVECAAGLWIGGKKSIVIMQNQGFYACMNSIRAVGIDAKIPLVLMIGAWGREFENLGQDPRQSKRAVVAMVEPVLEALGIQYWRVEAPNEVDNIGKAIDYAFEKSAPVAILMGAYTGW